jgi:DNA-binding LytR/AlgR family response regulator
MTATLRSLLVDDEQASRLRLRRLLSNRPEIQIIGEAEDGLRAVERIEKLQPDLIFLDVQMPGLDGFEVLRAISPPARPLVIFVTGFDEHALRAFQAQALAYLLKPVEPEQLDAMIERAWSIHSYHETRDEHDGKLRNVLEAAPSRGFERIVARKANRVLLLDSADICFFWIDAGIVRVQTIDESYWVNYAVGELEAVLSGKSFFRAHRSFLVNLNMVDEIRPDVRSGLRLVMKDRGKTAIDVSERQGRLLRALIPGL